MKNLIGVRQRKDALSQLEQTFEQFVSLARVDMLAALRTTDRRTAGTAELEQIGNALFG